MVPLSIRKRAVSYTHLKSVPNFIYFSGQILTVVQQCRIDGQNTDGGTWQVQLDAMTSGLTLKETGYETGRSVRDAMSE